MIAWHLYDLATGLFTGCAFDVQPLNLAQVARHTPAGCGALWGDFDSGRQKVDLATGDVVAWTPPAPSDAVVLGLAKQGLHQVIQARIEALEALLARPLREVGLAQIAGVEAPPAAVQRLQAANAAIGGLRVALGQVAGATTLAQLQAIEAGLA